MALIFYDEKPVCNYIGKCYNVSVSWQSDAEGGKYVLHEVFDIKTQGSLQGARLITYIQTYNENYLVKERPCILIMPGGGYTHLAAAKEGEALALRFCAMGYHAAVLEYSVAPQRYPTQLLQAAKAVVFLREHAEQWHIDKEKILVCGSSAGGHLAASLGCFWHEDFVAEALEITDKEKIRPNGMILSYPVITGKEKAHKGSFVNLCGDRYDELVDKLSLENQVSEYTPKAFIWHTFADQSVPVENALLFASALKEKDIPFELHIYPVGRHGLGPADWTTQPSGMGGIEPQCQSWVSLVKIWLENL